MENTVIALDLGGSKCKIAVISAGIILSSHSFETQKKGGNHLIDQIIEEIRKLTSSRPIAIGIGVPSYVDVEAGIIYDTANIPAWEEVPLKAILEEQFNIPVFLNNDANCFALGEKFFGSGLTFKNMVAITLGTGLGAGIIIDEKLYQGTNCAAGEIGLIPYLDYDYEMYASGKFFHHFHHTSGEEAARQAQNGDKESLAIFHDFGFHLAHLVKAVMLTYDPQAVIFGGSVSQSWDFFYPAIKKGLADFPFKNQLKNLRLIKSNNHNTAVLGAGHLTNLNKKPNYEHQIRKI